MHIAPIIREVCKMKKTVTLLLATALLFGMTFAASAGDEEPVVLTMAFTGSAPPEVWKESNELKMLEEELNIRLDYTYYDDDKFALLLAGGDIPDIVMPRQKHLTTIIDNGLALNLDPLLSTYAPNLAGEAFQASNELSRQMLGGEKQELYFLAVGLGMESEMVSETTSRGYTVRWDLYKELGCPPINSDDDYIEVIRKMVELYPETEDGRKVYGMGLYDDLSAWYTRGAWIRDGGALCIWTISNYQYMATLEDTTLVNGYMNTDRSAFWTDMKFYNKLYKAGLLDPDSFIMTIDEWNAKIAGGEYVAAIYANGAMYNENRKTDPNTLAGLIVVPSENAVVGSRKLQVCGGMPTDTIFISKNSQNAEAALKALNFFADDSVVRMTYCGIQGKDWDYDENGVPYITEQALKDRDTYGFGSDEYVKATGICGQLYNFTFFQGTALAEDGYVYNLAQMPDERVRTLDPMRRDMAETYGVSRPSEALMNLVYEGKTIDNLNDYAQLVALSITDLPLDIQRIMNNLNDILYNAVPSLVMAESQEEFDAIQAQVLADLENANEATAWEWYSTRFDAAKEAVTPAYQEALERYQSLAK